MKSKDILILQKILNYIDEIFNWRNRRPKTKNSKNFR